MAFYTNKNWYKSKTIWGSILTAVLGVVGLFTNLNIDSVSIGHYVDVAFVILGVFTGYGRVAATTAIGSPVPAPTGTVS